MGAAGAKRAPKADHKKKKDPAAPKRGLSAYMFFANEQRDQVIEQLQSVLPPGEKYRFGDVGKMLGEQWKALNEKQKQPYEAKAAEDKLRYAADKDLWDKDPEQYKANQAAIAAQAQADNQGFIDGQQLGF